MNHLHNAVRKCSEPFEKMWCGYLTPLEILALNDIGVVCNERDIDLAIDWKHRGISNGHWFYFDTNDEFEALKHAQI